MRALSSESVANYFIQRSFNEGVPLTSMKLLKLVYIAHGWHLGYFDKPLINDAVQAWQYGPVIPDLYRKIKMYGHMSIDAPVEGFGVVDDGTLPNTPPDDNTVALLDRVWQAYSKFDGIELSSMTHQHGTPWHHAWNENLGSKYHGAIISNDLIKAHYQQKIHNA